MSRLYVTNCNLIYYIVPVYTYYILYIYYVVSDICTCAFRIYMNCNHIIRQIGRYLGGLIEYNSKPKHSGSIEQKTQNLKFKHKKNQIFW